MSFDSVFTHAMVQELQQLVTGRLTKIQQPFANELILTIRVQRQNVHLLLSANPTYARVQLTQAKLISPPRPSNFVMTLRKQLAGAVIQGIEQIKNDRIMTIKFTARNELGDLQNLTLYTEIMNRHSNIILVNDQNGQIIDAIKHVSVNQDRYRELLPGVSYRLPPAPKSTQEPCSAFDREKFVKQNLTSLQQQDPQVTAQLLQTTFMGLGKDTLQELTWRLCHSPQDYQGLWQAFQSFFQKWQPTLNTNAQQRQIFTPVVFQSLVAEYQQQAFPSLSSLLDDFYRDRARKDRMRQQAANVLQVIKRHQKRNRLKLKRLRLDLAKTDSAEIQRIKGEVLTAFLQQVPTGAHTVTLPNYYEANRPLKIQLDPALSPARNAQKYFKTYQKLKNSVKHLQEQIKLTQTEEQYLTGILSQLDYAQPEDLDAIVAELQQQGYLRSHAPKKKKRSKSPRHGSIFTATDGTKIHVGKNNLQNDYLTTKWADKRYTWLHIKNAPGAHVIIENLHPSETTLTQAAQLAAYFSAHNTSQAKVAVDYTLIKHVHKPNGAKPGYVIYTDQKTIMVQPASLPTSE